jgi:hypothetical protein
MSEEILAAAGDLTYWRRRCEQAEAMALTLERQCTHLEDVNDRIAGAFELHMEMLELKQTMADYAGIVYDVTLGALLDQLEAERAALNDLRRTIILMRDAGHELPGSLFVETFAWEDAALEEGVGER